MGRRGMHRFGCGKFEKEICEKAEQAFENKSSFFIGSHPMAGSEKAGMEFASAELLSQKNVSLPLPKIPVRMKLIKLACYGSDLVWR